ncbi:phage tail spike protein [Clostridium perfringens]|uniref:phage tail spike protein n=2 Tax=Clostridium perfringens TaxID=1502 RepID=UPI0039E902AF
MTVPNFLKENTELKLKKLNEVDELGAYFSIPFITDIHNDETNTYNYLNSARVIQKINESKNINYILTGGDYIDNSESKEEVINRLKNFKDRFLNNNLLITLGNHDDNSMMKDFSKVITHAEMKKIMFSDMQDVTFGNGLYYYKDFHNYKIRLIVLNSEDIPEYDSSMKYKGQWDYAFSNEQLNWVAHTALNTDYKIIFCSHTPMVQNVEGFDLAIRNSEAMLGIMKAYTLGESYSSSNTTGDFKYNVSVTYNKKGTIVCCLFGHVHADNVVYKDNIAHISTTCDKYNQRFGSSQNGQLGNFNEIAFDVLTVKDDKGYLTRFGEGKDRIFNYINNTNKNQNENINIEVKNKKDFKLLQLFDKEKRKIAGLVNYRDLCIESILTTGDKKLSFSYPKESKYYEEIVEEGYIRTKKDEFVIKARDVGIDYTRFECVLNLETLEANIFDRFESVEQTITASLNLAIVGTGWTVKDNTLKKKRTVRCTNKNALEIVQEIKKTYRVDIVFNTLKREIEVYEKLGEDKGTYFIDSLNLTALQVQSDSYKFATRIIAEGKDKLTFADINGGKNYVENYQYSNKVKTIYWKDERYTVKESLLEDAKAKLKEISKPFTSYNASVLNLAELNPKYKNILDYQLGDTITLISRNNKVKDKQRIVKTVEYPLDHSRDTVELANAVLKFEDIQQENQETTDTVSNITVDNGTIDGSTIDGIKVNQIDNFKANVVEAVNLKAINANIDNLHVNKADIQDLHAVTAKIGTLEATKADITQLNAVNADISNLNAIKANIVDLNSATAKIGVLESKTASIDNLLAGNLTANNFKANSITANSGIIAEGAIGSGQISSLTANKINAGTIDLSLVTVAGPNGRLRLQGNKLQIMDNKDGKLYERIMLGVDSNNNSSLVLRGADGKTILLNQDGLTKAGITEGFNKIDDNSIDASLIFDKNSMVRNINGATETIRGTRVQIGDRTLDVELSTQKNTITEHSKELSTQKATIQALDNAIKLKVDTQTFTQSNTSINSKIDKVKDESIKAAENLALEKSNLVKKYAEEVAIAKANLAKEEAIASADGKITAEEKKRIQQAEANLNTAISKADKAKQDAILEANRVAELKKTEAIKTAGLDATNKANNALKDAKDYTNSEIITVNTHLNKSTSEINLLKDEITLKVNKSDVDKTIKTIEDKIKLTTDKITTVESKLTQENNSIKASVQDLNSTTQTITANISNISKDLTSKINSNLDAAKSFATDIAIAKATIAKEDAINVASLDATSKSSNALNAAKNYIDLEVKTINTKVHNLESGIDILKDQIKSKVSQSDIDKSITTVDDKVKILNSNISDVSSNLTQLKDSVTANIEAINSKTHSIETKLGVKASKEEVTEVNNRVATIKASLDSITQRVSSTESKTHILETNLNSKASKEEITNVNNKVVSLEANLSGITNRVSSTESRINALDGKVAGAVTLQQFTEFKQSNRDFQLKVAQTTNLHNLVPNGTFAGGLREWMCGGEFWSGTYTGYGFSGKICGAVKNKSTSEEKFLTSYKAFKVEKNTTYTLNFHYKVEQNVQSMEAFVMLSNTEYGDYGQIIKVMEALGGERSDLTNDIPHTFTFNTGNFEWLWLRFDNNGMKPNTNLDEYCWLYISEVAVYKGNVGAVKYLPKGGETYDTTFKLDGMGYNCKFASGAWNQIGAEGNMWYAPGMQYPYRSLSYHEAVSINTDGSNNYIYRDVQLPARFDYVDPQYIDITSSLKGWYKYTGKIFNLENITVSTGKVYRANGHTYAQIACRGCIRHADTFGVEGLQVVATLHVTA